MKISGNVYAVHDEPVSIGDAMYLDPEYIRFLLEMQGHHHDRVKKVARAVLTTIEEAIEAGSDVTQERTLHEQHAQRLAALGGVEDPSEPEGFYSVSDQALAALDTPAEDLEAVEDQNRDTTDRVQNLNANTQIQKLNSDSKIDEKQPDTTQVQNLNSANQVQKLNLGSENRVQNLNSVPEIEEKQADSIQVQNLNSVPVCSSSFYIKTTTTTTTPQEVKPPSTPERETTGDKLHFPQRLGADELVLARIYLGGIGSEQRQDVLDELQGRLGNAGKGGQPIHNPLGYLAQLCNAVKTGAFQLTSFGLQVRQAREQAAVREKSEVVKDRHHRQTLLAQPPPKSPLVDKLLAIRQQADGRKRGSRSSEATIQEAHR